MSYTEVDVAVLNSDAVQKFIDLAFDVVKWNGNRKSVCSEINLITTNYEQLVNRHNVKRHTHTELTSLYGCCWSNLHYWDGQTRSIIQYAVIYIAPNRGLMETVITLTHEVAHALTQGAHGYTWRRMYSLLLPLACQIFNINLTSDHLTQAIIAVVDRYAIRTHSGWAYNSSSDNEEFISRMKKMEIEVTKHNKAAARCMRYFGGILS